MARKKEGKMPVAQEDNEQAQRLLAQFHQIASHLHTSGSQAEVETALNDITSVTESAQTAFLKALSRERDVDAADILQAMYEFGPIKSIRKEARRRLIGLEEARIYPQWSFSPGRIAAVPFIPSYLANEVDEDEDEDDEEDIVRSGMPPQEVLTSFLENLEWGTDKLAYDLLSSDSSIRNGLSKDEWVERHRTWAKEVDPTAYRTEFSRLLDPEQANIDLLASLNKEDVSAPKKFEVGWSIRMSGTPLKDTIWELPIATAINQETKRHWFWTTYTLVQEQDEWRIQSMTDEVTKARNLSIPELRERIHQHAGYLDEFSKHHSPLDLDEYLTDSDEFAALEEARWRSGHTLAYYDALIEKAPHELAHYQLAAARSLALNDFERGLVYFDLMLERFPEKRDETLLQLGGIQIKFIQDLGDRLDLLDYEDEVAERFRELAEANLRESLSLNDNYVGHLLLAQLLKNDDNRLDEAEEQLRQARALAPDEATEAVVEHDMGTLAMIREDYEQALEHYRRVAEIHPDSPKAWADIADAYSGVENFEEAEASYRHAIELRPDDVNLYVGLSTMYMANQQFDRSRELWEEGLRTNPDSADFRFYLAMTLAERGEFLRAQTLLEEAEQIDPNHEMAPMISQMLNTFKTTKLPVVNADEQPSIERAPVPEHKQLSGIKPPTKFSKARKRKKK